MEGLLTQASISKYVYLSFNRVGITTKKYGYRTCTGDCNSELDAWISNVIVTKYRPTSRG
jgi:hypothetical protein